MKKNAENADVKPTYKFGDKVRNKVTEKEGSVYAIEHSGVWRVVVDVGDKAKYVWPAVNVEAVVAPAPVQEPVKK